MLDGNVPQNWEDVWNTKDFPGMRTFRKSVRGMLESATMAMGVPMEDVYEALGTDDGIKAAIDKFRQLQPEPIPARGSRDWQYLVDACAPAEGSDGRGLVYRQLQGRRHFARRL